MRPERGGPYSFGCVGFQLVTSRERSIVGLGGLYGPRRDARKTRRPMENDLTPTLRRRRDRIQGLAIIVLAFGGCMGLSIWGMRVSTPRPAPAPLPASEDGVIGFPSGVRPFDVLERARALTLRDRFRGFEAKGVRPDGTLDFSQPGTDLRFVFQSPQGRGPQPVREPGTLPQRRYCGAQSVVVDKGGIVAVADRPDHPCGSDEIEELGVPTACTIDALWKIAEQKKIKRKGVATIEYFDAVGGPAFRFDKDRRTFVVSARDCRTEFKGREQRGFLPRR